MSELCWSVDLGRRDYREALAIQRELVHARREGRIPDVLLFVEHPPVYTVSRGTRSEHLLAAPELLERLGASVVDTDRGGDITFHGPGQIVGYPIVDLNAWKRDLHAYLRALEEVNLQALASHGIRAHREPGLTGVWHEKGKLAAMGVRVSRWVTSHGFALNVSTELEYFKHIVPCGIVGRSVTSMEHVLNAPVACGPVKAELADAFSRVFERNVVPETPSALEVGVRQ